MPRQAESMRSESRRRGAVLRATGLAGLLLLTSWATPVEAQGERVARVDVRSANVRAGCSLSAEVIASTKEGDRVTIQESLGEWHRVRLPSAVEGCMHESVLELLAGETSEPSTAVEPAYDLEDDETLRLLEERREILTEIEESDDPEEVAGLEEELADLDEELRDRQEELRLEEEERLAAERDEALAEEEELREAAIEQESATSRAEQPTSTNAVDWTGWHLGLNVGYGFGSEITATSSLGTSSEEDVDGAFGGAQIGYSHQFNRFVVGGEADFQISNQSGATSDLAEIGFPGSRLELEYESFGSVRARAGIATGRALLYLAAGYAYLDAESRFTGPLGEVLPAESVSFGGLTVGVGVETALASQLSLKGEVLYLDFDDEPELEGDQFHGVRFGVNWHF